jgi:aspartate/methionine/tyrosine aminotransferase
VIADPALARGISRAHQFLTFTTPPNLQRAAAFGLGKDDSYFSGMRVDLARSRDRLVAALTAQGYRLDRSAGTYFVSIDLAASGIATDDVGFCTTILDHGVAAIPVSAFYAATPATGRVRLCFAKRDDVLDAAAERLGRARQALV